MEIAAHASIAVIETSQPSAVRFAARADGRARRLHRGGLVSQRPRRDRARDQSREARALGRDAAARGSAARNRELELVAIDKGPGIANVAGALADGHSTAGTTGIGLGAARRMSDEFDIYSSRAGRHGRPRAHPAQGVSAPRPPSFSISGVSVAKAGETECGDAWMLHHVGGRVRGDARRRAGPRPLCCRRRRTRRSRAALGVEPGRLCEDAGDGARSASATRAAPPPRWPRSTLATRVLTFAGVGNIGAAIVDNGSIRQAVSHNGTLGHQARGLSRVHLPVARRCDAGDALRRPELALVARRATPGCGMRHPALIAAVLYRDFSRGRDDVTVVVAKEAA